jgi:hypothetical protein
MTNTVPCRVLILLPARDFDPSEVAVTWHHDSADSAARTRVSPAMVGSCIFRRVR